MIAPPKRFKNQIAVLCRLLVVTRDTQCAFVIVSCVSYIRCCYYIVLYLIACNNELNDCLIKVTLNQIDYGEMLY